MDETDKPHFQTLKNVYQNQAILRLVSKSLAPQFSDRMAAFYQQRADNGELPEGLLDAVQAAKQE